MTPIKGETCSCDMVKLNEEDRKPCPDVPKTVKVQSQSHTIEERRLITDGELYERHHDISTVVVAGEEEQGSEAESISAVMVSADRVNVSRKEKSGAFPS